MGHLTRWWLWLRLYRPNGSLARLSDAALAEAAGWKGDAAAWCLALRELHVIGRANRQEVARGWCERNDYWVCETTRKARQSNPETRALHTCQDIHTVHTVQDKPKTTTQSAQTVAEPTVVSAGTPARIRPPKQAPIPKAKPSPIALPPERLDELTKWFAWIYNAYPRHVGRDTAWQAFLKLEAELTAETVKAMGRDCKRRVEAGEWQPDDPERKRYIPHLSTYLHQRRWTDED